MTEIYIFSSTSESKKERFLHCEFKEEGITSIKCFLNWYHFANDMQDVNI